MPLKEAENNTLLAGICWQLQILMSLTSKSRERFNKCQIKPPKLESHRHFLQELTQHKNKPSEALLRILLLGYLYLFLQDIPIRKFTTYTIEFHTRYLPSMIQEQMTAIAPIFLHVKVLISKWHQTGV